MMQWIHLSSWFDLSPKFKEIPKWSIWKEATQAYYGYGEGRWYSEQVWRNLQRMKAGLRPKDWPKGVFPSEEDYP